MGVVVAQPQSVEQSVELSGRTTAFEISEVRPQTSGVILKHLLKVAMSVKVKRCMNSIRVATVFALDSSKAALLQQQKQNRLNSLRTKLNRYQQLVSINAVSKQEYDDLLGSVKVTEAQVAAAQAQDKKCRN